MCERGQRAFRDEGMRQRENGLGRHTDAHHAEGARDVQTADAGHIKNKTAAVKTAAVFSIFLKNKKKKH